jgi:CRISPR-associated protein Csx16
MSNVYFITRHSGALEWLNEKGFDAPEIITHWVDNNTSKLKQGDIVIGILPIDIIAEINNRGARFIYLSIKNLPQEFRGKELTKEQLIDFGASLQEFFVKSI